MPMIGFEFQPGADKTYRKRLNEGREPLSHEALRVLSLHLPAVLGSSLQQPPATPGPSALTDLLGNQSRNPF